MSSGQARSQHRTLPLFTKTQALVREYAFYVVNHLELTRTWTFPPHEGTTFHMKIVQSSAQYKLSVTALPMLPATQAHGSCRRSSRGPTQRIRS